MIFKPRQVPPSNIKFWFVEALALSRRRLFHFLALSVASYFVISIEAGKVTMFLPPILFPVILALGCAIAKSGDESVPFIEVVFGVGSGWLRVATAAAIPWTGFLLIYVLLPEFNDGSSGDLSTQVQEELRQADGISNLQAAAKISILALGAIAVACIFFRFTCLIWFLWTLCSVANLPIMEALDQSYDAVSINKFVIWPYTISTVLLFVLPMLLGIWVLFPWLAITCSMLYASYRDVWLSRNANYPVRSGAVSLQGSPS